MQIFLSQNEKNLSVSIFYVFLGGWRRRRRRKRRNKNNSWCWYISSLYRLPRQRYDITTFMQLLALIFFSSVYLTLSSIFRSFLTNDICKKLYI